MIILEKIKSIELNAKRITEILLHVFFLGLIAIAYKFFLERTIPFDGAFYSFKIIVYENFNIENGRWGACYNQLLPLAGVKLGLSLPTILKLYSVSFALCNYLFFLIIYYRFRQVYTAVAFALVQVVFFRFNFFYQVSEIHAAVGPVFLLLATLLSTKFMVDKKWIGAALIFALFFWLMNIHLLSIIPILFCLAFAVLHEPKKLRNLPFLMSGIVGIVYFAIKLISVPANSYQSQKLVSWENIENVFTNMQDGLGYKYFLIAFGDNYVFPTCLLGFMVLFYATKKMFLKLLLLVISVLGFWVLIMAGSIKEQAPIVCENYYAVFGYFLVIPFSIDFLQQVKFNWFFPLTTFVLIFSLVKILTCGWFLHNQIDYYKRTADNLRHFKEKKFMLSEKSLDWDRIWVAWDFPFQSLLVSSLESPDSAITFYATRDSSYYTPNIFQDTTTLVGVPWSPFWFSSNSLPSEYFKLKNTLYRSMNTIQDTSFKPEVFTQANLGLSIFQEVYCFYHNEHNTIPIEIANRSNKVFYSKIGQKQQSYLGYRIYAIKDNALVKEGRTNLDLDVYPNKSILTGLVIPKRFLPKGGYYVEVDMVDEYKRWYGIAKKFNLVML